MFGHSESCKVYIGKNWATELIKRRPDLRSCFSKPFCTKRGNSENEKQIREWIEEVVGGAISKYAITKDDIYNFDETGFAMCETGSAKVVTGSQVRHKRKVLGSANREWVTAIDCINASGWVLPPLIIFKGKVDMKSWFNVLPFGWRLEVSRNGWTSHDIGLRWLKNTFDPAAKKNRIGKYRLSIFDGHGSHVTEEFLEACHERDIIPLCMPPHSSHILQPLDVGCFGVLKTKYKSYISELTGLGKHVVDKFDFIESFQEHCTRISKRKTLDRGFPTSLYNVEDGLYPSQHSRLTGTIRTSSECQDSDNSVTPIHKTSQGSIWHDIPGPNSSSNPVLYIEAHE
ncbi:hypothetical protein JCM33374_g4708 [Metschnikowia sp. JCM 33374]|nr:hypothetical protein JCM33374_g4708 [Metschnikowia sp. JCM 33374]